MIEIILVRVLSAAIAYHTIVCLNDMTPATSHLVRSVYVVQAGGALGTVFGLDYALPLLMVGIAALPFVDRRRPLHG